MESFSPAEATAAPEIRDRDGMADRFKWSLTPIFADWHAWKAAYDHLDTQIAAYASLRGTLATGPDRLLTALKLSDDIGQLSYKVWYFASLWHDQDQRDNQTNGKRQQVQILLPRPAGRPPGSIPSC